MVNRYGVLRWLFTRQGAHDFSFPERLIIESARLWMMGEGAWRMAANGVIEAVGAAHGESAVRRCGRAPSRCDR